jgi:hypothetical protein
MSFAARSTEDLVQIAAFGGGFTLDAANRSTDELVRIVAFASKSGAQITLRGMEPRSTDDLVRIATFARGCVRFEGIPQGVH